MERIPLGNQGLEVSRACLRARGGTGRRAHSGDQRCRYLGEDLVVLDVELTEEDLVVLDAVAQANGDHYADMSPVNG